MKVFLSWSGENSRKLASVFHDWLPTVIQYVRPYMSAESIPKGERWSSDIAKELDQTQYGIICMVPGNIAAPWIMFESGALSKSLSNSRVSPVLWGLSPSDFRGSPLLQFQLTEYKREEILKLLYSINSSATDGEKIPSTVLARAFDRSWLELDNEVSKIPQEVTVSSEDALVTQHKTGSMEKLESAMEEILTNTRTQIKILTSSDHRLSQSSSLWNAVHKNVSRMERVLYNADFELPERINEAQLLLHDLDKAFRILKGVVLNVDLSS